MFVARVNFLAIMCAVREMNILLEPKTSRTRFFQQPWLNQLTHTFPEYRRFYEDVSAQSWRNKKRLVEMLQLAK